MFDRVKTNKGDTKSNENVQEKQGSPRLRRAAFREGSRKGAVKAIKKLSKKDTNKDLNFLSSKAAAPRGHKKPWRAKRLLLSPRDDPNPFFPPLRSPPAPPPELLQLSWLTPIHRGGVF